MILRSAIDRFKDDLSPQHQISEFVTEKLEIKYPGAWICVVGRKFVVNIMHEHGYFMRASTEHCHFVIFKLKFMGKN